MKILYHHRTHGTGAEGVHISQIVKGLRHLGHQVTVVSPGGHEPSETAGANPFASHGGLKRRIMTRLSRLSPQVMFEGMELSYNLAGYMKLRPQLTLPHGTTGGPTVDLIYERQAFFLGAGAYLAQRTQTPYFVEVNELAGEKRVRGQVLVSLAKRIERFVFQRADQIIVVSDFLKEKVAESGVDEKKIQVMPNGVDPEIFTPTVDGDGVRREFGIEPSSIVIGFVGWLVPWHSLEMLIEVVGQLAPKYPVRLLLVGDGSLKGSLSSIAQQRGVSDRVIFAGAVPYQDVPRYVKAMDICVIPAANAYRSPIKLFEYMAMGKPVVAPDHQPIARVMRSGETGITFRAGDTGDLCAALARLMDDGAQREALGTRALSHVLQNHLWRHNAEKVISLYEEVRRVKKTTHGRQS
jgi:glycosyltransferase involved in cell wall biosynthesis